MKKFRLLSVFSSLLVLVCSFTSCSTELSERYPTISLSVVAGEVTSNSAAFTIEAEGAAEKIAPQDTVWVNYKGTLLDGTVFDENDSTMFVANRVIRGWTEGLGLIGEGGKATLYIPSDLAYGERGNRSIEPNSVLVFDVDVLKVGKFVAPEAK